MTKKKKVFITRKISTIAQDTIEDSFETKASVDNFPISNDDLKIAACKYDAILSTVCDKFDNNILSCKNRKVEVISNYAVGVDNIDVESAKRNKVFVYNTPGVVTDSTADMAMALLLSLSRKIGPAQQFVKENRWNSWNPEIFLGSELRGKTLGIIGFGRIGQAVAARAVSFGISVVYYNRSKKDFNGASRCENLTDLLSISDFISIHLSLTEETRHFIGIDEFKMMKRSPLLINTARGNIISNDVLDQALSLGYISGAALDVVENEPIGSDHRLLSHKNCVIVPHIGTATNDCRDNMAKIAAMNIILHYNIKERVEKIFRNLMCEEFSLFSNMYNTGDWDSLKHLVLLSDLEKEFNIEIEHHEASQMIDGYEIINGVFNHVFKCWQSSL